MRISKHIFGFDAEYQNLLSKELQQLNAHTHSFPKDLFKINKFIFNIVRQKLKALVFTLLPFSIYCHVLLVGVVVKLPANINFSHVFLIMIWLLVMLLRTILPFAFKIFNRRLFKT